MEKNVEGKDFYLIWGTLPEFGWTDLKLEKKKHKITGFWVEIWNCDFPNCSAISRKF